MWRQLHREYHGTGELVDSSGRKVLQNFPQCTSMDALSNHLDTWNDWVTEYGQNLASHCPETLRTMLLVIIPTKREDELDHPMNHHVKTVEQIIEWCKKRTTKSRNEFVKLNVSSSFPLAV